MEAARRTNGSLQQIAADLGATLSVVGSYQRLGGRIRITARVVDVATGEAIADAKVDGPFDRIFELQDEVVARFSRDLGVPTAQPRTSGRNSRDTASLEAYRAFIEGSLRLETLDIREIPAAIADFERAVGLDRRYAPGYAGLASAEFALYETTRADVQPADDLLQRAIGHARDALRLDDTLAEAHATLALLLTSGWQPDEAVAAARRAIAIDPDNWRHLFRLGHASWGHQRLRAAANMLAQYPDFAFAHFQVAMVHVARGHLAEAESVLRQGAAVQDRQIVRGERYPALGLHWLLGLVRLAQDDVEEARTELDRERELAQPHRLYGREYAMNALHGIGATLLRGGNPSSAIDHFARALALYPDDARSHLGIALAHRAEGSQREADAALRRVEDALARLVTRPAEAGIVRAELRLARDDADGAIRTLGQMLAEAPRGFAGWTLPVEPFLRQLHADERFAAVLTRLADRAR
jgi:tetratricopeptide (TPR) repeat protein